MGGYPRTARRPSRRDAIAAWPLSVSSGSSSVAVWGHIQMQEEAVTRNQTSFFPKNCV